MPGATVSLDDGRVQTSNANAFYDFANVTPRLACVTVAKTGYKTKRQCQTVDSGIQAYNSVVLEPGTDPVVDAGVPDASETDASLGGDGGFGGRIRQTRTTAQVVVAAAPGAIDRRSPSWCCVGWMLARRRGTTS